MYSLVSLPTCRCDWSFLFFTFNKQLLTCILNVDLLMCNVCLESLGLSFSNIYNAKKEKEIEGKREKEKEGKRERERERE